MFQHNTVSPSFISVCGLSCDKILKGNIDKNLKKPRDGFYTELFILVHEITEVRFFIFSFKMCRSYTTQLYNNYVVLPAIVVTNRSESKPGI